MTKGVVGLMNQSDLSKRRFLKLMIGTGVILPGVAAWLGSSDLHHGWQTIQQKLRLNAVPHRRPATASREEGEATILYREDRQGDVLRVNGTAAHIWRMCDGRHSIHDMATHLSSRFDVPLPQSVKDATFVITVYRDYGLVDL